MKLKKNQTKLKKFKQNLTNEIQNNIENDIENKIQTKFVK
jgi:predicted transcriptional regulator